MWGRWGGGGGYGMKGAGEQVRGYKVGYGAGLWGRRAGMGVGFKGRGAGAAGVGLGGR